MRCLMQRINYRKICILGIMLAWLFTLAACGSAGIGQTSGRRQDGARQPTPTPLPTPIIPEKPIYTVQSGTVVRRLEFTGRASPLLEQELFFRADGFVGDVLVERGDWVQAGDVLAELEISGLEFQLAQQQLALQTAESSLAQSELNLADSLYLEQVALEKAQINLQQVQLGDSNVAILSAEINLAQAQDAVADAQEAYELDLAGAELAVDQARTNLEVAKENLVDVQNPATVLDLTEARLAVDQAKTNLEAANENLVSVKAGPTEAQLASAEAAVETAEESYEGLLAGSDPEAVEQAKLGLDQARNSLWSAQVSRDSTCGASARGDAPKSSCETANASVANAEIAVQLAEISYQQAQESATAAQIANAAAQVQQATESLEELHNSPTSLDLAQAGTQVTQAEYNLAQAQETLAEIEAGADPLDLAQAEVQVAQAEYNLAQAQETLAEEGGVGVPNSLGGEAVTASVALAQDNLRLAQAEYNAMLSSNQAADHALRSLELDIAVIEFNIEQLERGVNPMLSSDLAGIQLGIEELERQVADARLSAPFEGEVLSVGIDPGDYASAFSIVMVLADPGVMEITAELGAADLGEMALGQEALITLRNRPQDPFGGSVRQLPYPYGGGTTDASDSDLSAHIAIEGDVELELGELAKVSIVLEEKENVLWLPPAAIRTFQGRDFVVVQLDEGTQRVDVLLGIETDERVEIVQGLEEGQIIVGE